MLRILTLLILVFLSSIGHSQVQTEHVAFIVRTHLLGELNAMIAVAQELHVKVKIVEGDELMLVDDLPEMIFHALGDATEVREIALFKRHFPKVKIFNFGDPLAEYQSFDLIFRSSHLSGLAYPNVVPIEGVPTQVTESVLRDAGAQWESTFSRLPAPFVGVLIGGSTKNAEFTPNHAISLAKALMQLRNNQRVSFLITSSRRTSDAALSAFRETYVPSGRDFISDFDANVPTQDPYKAILAKADYLIVTGDSMSMISDALRTGKPTFVFAPDGSLEERHKAFIIQQARQGRLRPLGKRLTDFSYTPLNAAASIAEVIRQKFISLWPKRFENCDSSIFF